MRRQIGVTSAAQDRQELADMFREQRERSREKFGRGPGSDDPVVFIADEFEARTREGAASDA